MRLGTPASTGPRFLRTLGLIGLLLPFASCASTTRLHRASDVAVGDLIGRLDRKAVEVEADNGELTRLNAVVGIPDRNLRSLVMGALNDQESGLRIVAFAEDHELLVARMARELGDDYRQPRADERAQDTMAELSTKPVRGEGIGNSETADLFIHSSTAELDNGEIELRLRAWQLASSAVYCEGSGTSYGTMQRTATVLHWLVVPFTVVYDIADTSVERCFASEKEPTFWGTLGRAGLSILYLPVAVFRSDYDNTRSWLGRGEKSPESETARAAP